MATFQRRTPASYDRFDSKAQTGNRALYVQADNYRRVRIADHQDSTSCAIYLSHELARELAAELIAAADAAEAPAQVAA